MNYYSKRWIMFVVLAAICLYPRLSFAIELTHTSGSWYVAPAGNDDNDCLYPNSSCATINGALAKAAPGDYIYVAIGTYTGSDSEVVFIDKDITLSGGWVWPGTVAMQSGRSTIDGEGARRGVTVIAGVTATIERFIIKNGSMQSNGGGIFNAGILMIDTCEITNNTTVVSGGGIHNQGTAVLKNSAVTKNIAQMARGGGIDNTGTLTLENSTVSGNLTLERNAWDAGGIRNNGGTVNLNNCTISNNRIGSGEGYYQLNSGGLYNYSPLGSSGTVTMQNTILADNIGGEGPDCYGVITSLGYNLIGNTSGCDTNSATGDLANLNAGIGPLQDSPGCHPLLPDSLAIQGGNPAGCVGSAGLLTTDQRGFPRFGRCDIGAYEMQPIGFSTKAVNRPTALPGSLITYTIVLRNEGPDAIPNVQIQDTLPDAVMYSDGSLSATSGDLGYVNGIITWTGTLSNTQPVMIHFAATVSHTLTFGTFVENAVVISGAGEVVTRTATFTVDGKICDLTKYDANPVLSVGPEGSWDVRSVRASSVLKRDTTYMLWYTGHDVTGLSRIGLATSTDGRHWTKHPSNNPVLSPSLPWEAAGVSGASVIADDGRFKMWYTGRDSDGVGRIGYATSLDGIAWSKYEGNPVLDIGYSGSWEESGVARPTVAKVNSNYHMWYEGYDGVTLRIGHTTSSDGVNWIKDGTNPVLDIGTPGSWDWLQTYGPSLVDYRGKYFLWYSGKTLPAAWQTGYATSLDGNNWIRQGQLLSRGSSGAFDAHGADYPVVIMDDNGFKVWYSGMNNVGIYNIGYATAELCESSIAPAIGPIAIYLPLVLRNWSTCPAYFSDDFSDPSSGWPISDTRERRLAYTGGQYQIWVKNPTQGWLVTPGAILTDFAVEVSARRANGVYGSYGIIFGLNKDWNQFYQVEIDDSYYSIWRYDGGNWIPLLDWTFSSHIHTGTNWNHLKVIRNGAEIMVYVNDHYLVTVTDENLVGPRRVGLSAFSAYDSSLDAYFDDFALYPVSCGGNSVTFTTTMGKFESHAVSISPGFNQTFQSSLCSDFQWCNEKSFLYLEK